MRRNPAPGRPVEFTAAIPTEDGVTFTTYPCTVVGVCDRTDHGHPTPVIVLDATDPDTGATFRTEQHRDHLYARKAG
jgi:hypothetical protein